MTPKRERVFRKTYARELIGIAEGDLESAKALLAANRGRPENICYHADLTSYTEFATTRRYEESDMILEQEDLEAAIKIAEDVLKWAHSHIN